MNRNMKVLNETRGDFPGYIWKRARKFPYMRLAAASCGAQHRHFRFQFGHPDFLHMSPVAPFRSLRYNADSCCSIFIPYLFFLSAGPPSQIEAAVLRFRAGPAAGSYEDYLNSVDYWIVNR